MGGFPGLNVVGFGPASIIPQRPPQCNKTLVFSSLRRCCCRSFCVRSQHLVLAGVRGRILQGHVGKRQKLQDAQARGDSAVALAARSWSLLPGPGLALLKAPHRNVGKVVATNGGDCYARLGIFGDHDPGRCGAVVSGQLSAGGYRVDHPRNTEIGGHYVRKKKAAGV